MKLNVQRRAKMTNDNPNAHIVRLPDHLIEKCKAWANEVVAHYTSGEDREANLPWTREDLTLEEFRRWVATREEAGLKIDIETCELGRWYAYDCDPYGANANLSEEMRQVGTNRFVRSPESRGWVHEGDLPSDSQPCSTL
jgi:hypothetical protein